MRATPETRYAWNGGVSIAYQVLGDGATDLLYLQGYASHVDLNWDGPRLSRFLRGLASHSRLIVTDRRGWGCSDRFSPYDIAPLETLTDDLLAVLDAAGSERAVVFGTHECAINVALFAASNPQRTRALILCDPFARYDLNDPARGPMAESDWNDAMEGVRAAWGRAAWVEEWPDAQEREWFVRYMRAAIPPGGLIAEMERYRGTNPSSVYPTIHAPTLILATNGGDPIFSAENGRYLANAIPGSILVQHDLGEPPWLHWYGRGDAILAEVGRHLAGVRDEEAILDRVLATVLFTDIVGSTAIAARVGDTGWRDIVERHHALIRSLLRRFRGSEVDTAGDGFFATFDGPGRALRCAEAIRAAVQTLDLEVRCGVHTGECDVIDGKVGGLAVSMGARIGALARPSEILVSDTVTNLVIGSGFTFTDRGAHELKGLTEAHHLYALANDA